MIIKEQFFDEYLITEFSSYKRKIDYMDIKNVYKGKDYLVLILKHSPFFLPLNKNEVEEIYKLLEEKANYHSKD